MTSEAKKVGIDKRGMLGNLNMVLAWLWSSIRAK